MPDVKNLSLDKFSFLSFSGELYQLIFVNVLIKILWPFYVCHLGKVSFTILNVTTNHVLCLQDFIHSSFDCFC